MTNMIWKKTAPFTAVAVPVLIIGGVLVKTIGKSENILTVYTRCAVVIIAAIIAFVCIRIFKMVPDDNIILPLRIGFCIASFFAIGQNLMFMARGLYRALTIYSTAGMTVAAIGIFLVIYAINTWFTVNGICIFIDIPWGLIAPVLIALAGAKLITIW